MSRLADPASRLARGSVIVARRLGVRLAAWVARGRRADLTGWKAVLGPIARVVMLCLIGWAAWAILRSLPLMWALAATWGCAAWRAGRAPKEAAEPPTDTPLEEAPAAPPGVAWRAFVDRSIGDRQGVHLRALLAALQEAGHHPSWKVADVRLACERAGVPIRPRVRVRGEGVSVGVHRDDFPSPTEADTTPSQEHGESELHAA